MVDMYLCTSDSPFLAPLTGETDLYYRTLGLQKGVPSFCSLESDIKFSMTCFDTW